MTLELAFVINHFCCYLDYHVAQINQKAEAERAERDNDFKSDKCLADLLELEQQQIEKYAEEVISSNQGRILHACKARIACVVISPRKNNDNINKYI